MKKLISTVLILLIVMVANGWTLSFTGSIVGGSTLTGQIPWNTSFTSLSWTVYDNPSTSYWTYDYTFTVPSKAISHVIIEVSDNFSASNIIETSSGRDPDAPKTYTPDGSNPFMPGNLYGIKWNTSGDPLSYSFYIVTDRAPMWGDFYAVNGKKPGEEVYAYNLQFGKTTTALIDNGNAGGWVLVPDTGTGIIPEPGTFLLLGTGLLGLAALRYRRSKK
jgi:hypothetical protein